MEAPLSGFLKLLLLSSSGFTVLERKATGSLICSSLAADPTRGTSEKNAPQANTSQHSRSNTSQGK